MDESNIIPFDQSDDINGNATFVIDGAGSATDGCEDAVENVQGKVALIDRGSCNFSTKALHAQNGGAIAAIICNNAGVNTIMGMPAGADAASVTIPAFAMSAFDCNEIRMFAQGGEIDVTLTYSCEPFPDPAVIWGNESGQGDFSNGLGDWTVVTDASSDTSWYWTLDPDLPGRYTNTNVVEGSACNGYMAFPSDYYDNLGNYRIPDDPSSGPDTGAGPCPNSGLDANFCIGSLYSPVIDLSASTIENLTCRFYHDWGYYYAGSTSLIASYDGGNTWPDTTYITLGERAAADNPEVYVAPNDPCQFSTASVNDRGEGVYTVGLPGYDNQGSVQLQFRHLGGYYHATIDDVQLIDDAFYDIEVLRSFVGRAPAAAMPLSQINATPLHVDIANNGNVASNEVMIRAQAVDANGNVEWETINSNFLEQPADCFLNENSTFAELFTPEKEGGYRVTYTNITPNEEVFYNDTVSFDFAVTKDLWRAAEKPAPDEDTGLHNQIFSGLISDTPGETGWCGYEWAMAYNFYLPNGDGHFMTDVRFGVNFLGSNSGSIKTYLYEWDQTDASLDPDGDPTTGGWVVAASDLVLVGCMGDNGFNSKENNRPMISLLGDQSDITIGMAVANPADGQPLLDANGNLQPLSLKSDQHYSLVFVMDPDTDGELDFIAADGGAGEDSDLNATNFALENLGLSQRYGARTACNLVDGGNFTTELAGITYGNGVSNQPWIEMTITDEISGTEDITPESVSSLEVFPNPASNVLIIDLALTQVSSQVSFELMNMNGQLVSRLAETNVKSGRFTMNVADLPAGVYTLNAERLIVLSGQPFFMPYNNPLVVMKSCM